MLARQLLADGVQGYVLKIDGAQGLVGVLTKVLVERSVPSCSEHVRRELLIGRREREVLQLIANGLIDKEIALKLNITINTVVAHKKNIFGKLDVHNATQAVANGLRLRIIT
jgi:DNA-binding NarL/FixJ family response regulator